MNARGGPGIVLASVAFDAAIISEEFYVSLVMLAIVTSLLLAGTWLERMVKARRPLLGSEPVKPRFESPHGAADGAHAGGNLALIEARERSAPRRLVLCSCPSLHLSGQADRDHRGPAGRDGVGPARAGPP